MESVGLEIEHYHKKPKIVSTHDFQNMDIITLSETHMNTQGYRRALSYSGWGTRLYINIGKAELMVELVCTFLTGINGKGD